jgi:hypothetical protein
LLSCQNSELCSCFITFQSQCTCLRKWNYETLVSIILMQQCMCGQSDDKCFWDVYYIFCCC